MIEATCKNRMLFSLPAHTVFGVFQDYPEFGELIANFVSAFKVPPVSSFLTLVNQALWTRHRYLGPWRPKRSARCSMRSMAAVTSRLLSSRKERGPNCVYLARQVMYGGQSGRIVLRSSSMPSSKSFSACSVTASQLLVAARLSLRFFQTRAKSLQTVDGPFGAAESASKVMLELFATRHAQQEYRMPAAE